MSNAKPKIIPQDKTMAAEAAERFRKLDEKQIEKLKRIARHSAFFRHAPVKYYPYINKHILPIWYDMGILTGFDTDKNALVWLEKDIKNHVRQLDLTETLVLINSCLAGACEADHWYKVGVTSALFKHLIELKETR